jgi:parallel beta-helix repeat protein
MTTLIPKVDFKNGGSTPTGAINRPINEKIQETISVEDFGAVGDGVTDDGPAIQNAVNYANSVRGQINFAGKTYLIKTAIELKSNITLVGQGNTIIFIDKTCTLGPSYGGTGRVIYTNNGQENISLYNITFEGTKVALTQITSIAVRDVTNFRVENCKFINFGDATYYTQGLVVFGGENITILNSLFDNCSGDGGAIAEGTVNFEFRGNTCSNNSDWGWAFTNNCSEGTVANNLFLNNTSTGTGADECVNMVFDNNISNGNDHGIRIARFGTTTTAQQFFTLTANVCNSNTFGISIESLDITGFYTCVGNTITYTVEQGIRIVDSGAGTVVGNQISDSGGEGILFESYTADTGQSAVVGNYISVCTYGIRQLNSGTAGSAKIVIVGNEILGFSAAALATINADYIDGNESANYFNLSKPISFPSGFSSPSATTGGTALPALAQGFLPLYLSGVLYKIPYYNA